MNESTRQLVLLTGIMSILIGGLVVINTANSSAQDPTEENNNVKEVRDINESVEQENHNTEVKNSNSNDTNVISQSLNGWQALWEDMETGWEAILNQSSSNS